MALSNALLKTLHTPLRKATTTLVASSVAFNLFPTRTLRRSPRCLIRTLPFVHQMENDTDRVAQAAVAFALPSLVQLLYVLYGLQRSREASPKLDRFQFGCWLFWFCIGTPIAVAFGLASAGSHQSALVLFEVWRGVSVLAAETFQVIRSSRYVNYANRIQIAIVAYPLYTHMAKTTWSKWLATLQHSWMFVLGHLILHYGLGIWGLMFYGLEFIWAAPASLHLVCLIVAVTSFIHSNVIQKRDYKHIIRFVSWIFIDLAALLISILSAVLRWEKQHLIQCLICLAVILEYLLGQLSIGKLQERRGLKHGINLQSQCSARTAACHA